jgi:hypothetical protein
MKFHAGGAWANICQAIAIVTSHPATYNNGRTGRRAKPEIMPIAWATRSQKNKNGHQTVIGVETFR